MIKKLIKYLNMLNYYKCYGILLGLLMRKTYLK